MGLYRDNGKEHGSYNIMIGYINGYCRRFRGLGFRGAGA